MNEQPLILVLDDDPDIGTMIKLMLEYHGYQVMNADNQATMKIVLSENEVDLILMDMLLSGIDGTDLCKQLKKEEASSSIPVIMFSAHPNARDICIAAGADDFIDKPFEMADMLGKIRNNLKQTQT